MSKPSKTKVRTLKPKPPPRKTQNLHPGSPPALPKSKKHAQFSHIRKLYLLSDTKSKGKSLVTSLEDRKVVKMDSDSSTVYGSLLDPLYVYPIVLGGYTSINITGGIVDAFIAADPSPAGWASPEWSALQSLFSEFKLVSLTVKVIRNSIAVPPTPAPIYNNLAIASNLGVASNPGSYSAISDNIDCRWYNVLDTTPHGVTHVMKSTELGWSELTTPTVEPFAGAPGCIQFFSNNGLASGTGGVLYQVLIQGLYHFRIRV